MASYRDERVAAIRSRNAQNKRRAKDMERKVAKFLEGIRVPYSGSGVQKGDCDVVTDKIGRIFIECKISAAIHNNSPSIRIDYRWLDKMIRDSKIIPNTKFAALVFKYHDVRLSEYVIVPLSAVELYADNSMLIGLPIIDTGDRSGITLTRKQLFHTMEQNPRGENVAMLHCRAGQFVIMDIFIFKDMIHDNTSIRESGRLDLDTGSGALPIEGG